MTHLTACLRKNTAIVIASVLAKVKCYESITSVTQSQSYHTENAFVVVVKTSSFTWTSNVNVLFIEGVHNVRFTMARTKKHL